MLDIQAFNQQYHEISVLTVLKFIQYVKMNISVRQSAKHKMSL